MNPFSKRFSNYWYNSYTISRHIKFAKKLTFAFINLHYSFSKFTRRKIRRIPHINLNYCFFFNIHKVKKINILAKCPMSFCHGEYQGKKVYFIRKYTTAFNRSCHLIFNPINVILN